MEIRQVGDVVKAVVTIAANGNLERNGHLVETQCRYFRLTAGHELGEEFMKKCLGSPVTQQRLFVPVFPTDLFD